MKDMTKKYPAKATGTRQKPSKQGKKPAPDQKLTDNIVHMPSDPWQVTFDALKDALCLIDTKEKILKCNKAMSEFLNKPMTEIIGKTCRELFHGISELFEECPVVKMQKFLKRETIELQVKDKWLEITADPIFDESGNLSGAVHILTDITESKKIQETLRESEQRFKEIFDKATDGIIIADNETKRFILGNKAICDMLGYNEDEIKNQSVMSIHPEKDLPYVLEQFDKMARREMLLAKNIPVKRRDGSIFYADINSFPVTIAGKKYMAGIFRDVTDRILAEAALRENEERLASIFRASPTGIGVVSSPDRLLLKVNERLCKMLGYSEEELIGKSARVLYPTDEDFEYVGRRKYELIRDHGVGTVETRWQRKDGRIIDVLLSSSPIDINNFSLGVTFTVLDITAKKRSDQLLQKREEELKKRVKELEEFYDMAVGRELRMIELKKQIEELKEQLGTFGITPHK
jgi:PAS domain S-box-containing protein